MRHLDTLLPLSVRGDLHLALRVLLSCALFAVLQLISSRHNVRFDLTPEQSFVLSPQARQVATALSTPVVISAFYNGQVTGQHRELFDLLEQFEHATPALSFRLLDLDRSPGLAQKYGISTYNTGVVEAAEHIIPLRTVDEPAITEAFLRLSRQERRRLCFVTGHGERSPDNTDKREGYSELANALEQERFDVTTINTIPHGGVPPECTVMILAGPSHDLLPGEASALRRYLRDGGKVLLLADPDAPPSILEFLRQVGIEAGNDLVVDERNRLIGADSFMPQVVQFHTPTFRDRLDAPALLSLARTIRPGAETPAGIQVTAVAATSPDSWALVGAATAPDDNVRFRRDIDQPGPLTVGILATFENSATHGASPTAPPGKLMVFGDSDFGTNFYLNVLGNKDLLMSSIAMLTDEPELIAVRRKGSPAGSLSPIMLTDWQGRVIFWIAVVVTPLSCLLFGGGVALVRQRQRGGR